MPPIPVHIDDPITPAKPQGVTPQTAANEPVVPSPATNVATTTAAAQTPGYPAARPGAAVAPAQTPYIPSPQPSATRTTQSVQNENRPPPPPQPGAVPVPFQQQAPRFRVHGSAESDVHPPSSGSAATAELRAYALDFHGGRHGGPGDGGNDNNNAAALGTRVTEFGPVASPAVGEYQDGNSSRRVSSEQRPGGYVQNVYAQELSPAQRASLDQETRRESFVDKLGLGGVVASAGAGVGLGGGGGGNGGEASEGDSRRVSEGVSGAWDAARGWFGKAGTAIAEGEQEVWRRINGH
ncbi:hypothetical protein B0A55_02381 [Friedmanniomyces simplex]|uniref:Uncharacterized protein n=1 Tax=Friedmanniomyces simplex TaxID=329884 RepID=A0A4U0XTG2_9PEZI|nr:hypothetical protein B0A55_02381 [Friedmanniomyces simplex]